MDIAGSARRYAFSTWLRTGQLPTARTADGVELKFNPWHDPRTGRFTFANGRNFQDGSWQGGGFPGGGEGRSGGGGASGSWDEPPKKKRAEPKPVASSPAAQIAHAELPPRDERPADETSPLRREVRNGYEYWIDASGRTRRVSGVLVVADKQVRSRTVQAQAGGPDRRSTDDGGHYGRPVQGAGRGLQPFRARRKLQSRGYRVLEDEWAREKRAGARVTVKISPVYGYESARPSAINVWFIVNRALKSKKFPNERREKMDGK
jgi:hypothetical protein